MNVYVCMYKDVIATYLGLGRAQTQVQTLGLLLLLNKPKALARSDPYWARVLT
jgi:hypothetical protein